MMIRRIFLFTSILILISPMIADETGLVNNSTVTGEQNISYLIHESTMNLTNTTVSLEENQTNNTTEGYPNLTVSQTNDKRKAVNQSIQPTPTPEYKLSIGSVYDSDYTEPQAKTFSYSGCQ